MRTLENIEPCKESIVALEILPLVIDEVLPLSQKHRAALKGDIRSLWEDLTSEQESRNAEYLGTPPALSAYIRYFLPWNVFRLASIFTNADFCLPDNAVITDIGSGPLTVPIALYAARPELRSVPLTIYCSDRVERVMETGRAIFESLAVKLEGRLPPWTIELRKESFGSTLPERAHLFTAANVFNEFFWKDRRPLGERALETAHSILSSLKENGSVFIMEPGDPRSGSIISSLRAAFIAEGATPLGPCPHALSCPMPGIFRSLLPPESEQTGNSRDPNSAPSRFKLAPVAMPKKRDKYPWCHFGIDAAKAPKWLRDLSDEVGLPKEKAVFSYLWAARQRGSSGMPGMRSSIPSPIPMDQGQKDRGRKGLLVRVISESFALPGQASGQYACSSLGYTLLKKRPGDDPFRIGELLEVRSRPEQKPDEKSGAIILPS
ncbi:MAG: small ribosomal subunit Rsm22 family protein [Rectinemataceae bacterium]